jgi:hypothetical protein
MVAVQPTVEATPNRTSGLWAESTAMAKTNDIAHLISMGCSQLTTSLAVQISKNLRRAI